MSEKISIECLRPSGAMERLEWYSSKPREQAIEAVARQIELRGLGLVREHGND